MGPIEQLLGKIDDAVAGYNEAVFNGFAGQAVDVFQVAGVLALVLIGINMVIQIYPVSIASGVVFLFRFGLVTLLAASWDNFEVIYDVLTDFPSQAGAEFLAAGGIGTADNLNQAMDEIVDYATEAATVASSQSSLFGVSLLGIVIGLIAGGMAAVAVLVLALGKVGLAFAISIAPLALLAYLFQFSNILYRRWTEMTIGFALIPLVVAAVMAAVIGVASEIAEEGSEADTIGAALPMIIILLAAIFMMARVPSIVAGLSGAMVAGSGITEGYQALRYNQPAIRGGRSLLGAAATTTGRASVGAVGAAASGASQIANRTGSEAVGKVGASLERFHKALARYDRRKRR